MSSNDILVALRRITRAIDLRSKELEKLAGLTVPQLLVLRVVRDAGSVNVSEIARRVSLSQGTATMILKRLVDKGLVRKGALPEDRRVVLIELTPLGREKLDDCPEPLQEKFVERFSQLDGWEQKMLVAAVERIAGILDAGDEPIAPILEVGELAPDPEASGRR